MILGLIQIEQEALRSAAACSGRPCGSLRARKNLLLRFRKFLIRQHTGSMELRQLVQLGSQPRFRGWRRRRCGRWCGLRRLLLHLIELRLLVRLLLLHLLHVCLLLGSRFLPGIFLLLMMADGACSSYYHSRTDYCPPHHTAAHHSSSWSTKHVAIPSWQQ
jgi:hypothetical protein